MSSNKIATLALLILVSVFVSSIASPSKVHALSGSEFMAGKIIDDSLFYDGDAMSAGQIQSFLNAKVPNCDTNGVKMHSSGVTRAQRGANYGNPAPFVCLKDFRQNTPLKVGESGLCSAMPARSNQTAAQIIYEVGKACSISQKALLVMLQKEQSLVTDDWPWQIQYTKAMGYYCPDDPNNPGWCHPDYAGFFNQVYNAALQFQRYKADPYNWNHIPGANNNILYQANAPHCGTKKVYIDNYATAGLYNYTPYTPNSAALNNLYGTGDGCSAYGNRNFWRYYNDWFGTTVGSDLVRTVSNKTVYLISEDRKYSIPNETVLSDFRVFGRVTFVPNSFLASKTDMGPISRAIKSDDSVSVYFTDAGYKLKFNSCGMLSDYGLGGCSGQISILTPMQINKLATGPHVTNFYKTTSGDKFFIKSGEKAEIFDDASANEVGLEDSFYNRLEADAISYLPLTSPVVRNDVLSRSTSSGNYFLHSDSNFINIPDDYLKVGAFKNLPKADLSSRSINRLPISYDFKGFVTNSEGSKYVLDNQGKIDITELDWTDSFVELSDTFLDSIDASQQVSNVSMIKSPASSSIYKVIANKKYKVASWSDLKRLNSNDTSYIELPSTAVNSIPSAGLIYGSTTLIKSSDSPKVYMVDGLLKKRMVSDFAITSHLGIDNRVVTVSKSELERYETLSPLSIFVDCQESGMFAGIGGGTRRFDASLLAKYGWTSNKFQSIDQTTCVQLSKGSLAPDFIKTSDGKIYKIESGVKRHIRGWGTYVALGGNTSNTPEVGYLFSNSIANGPSL